MPDPSTYPSASTAYRRAYYRKNAKKIIEQNKKWKQQNPSKFARLEKDSRLKRFYGISLEQWEALAKSQNYVCAICGCAEEYKPQPLSVDHCHKTGKVRSLLCSHCNIVVEYVENPKVPLERYIEYVRAHTQQG